MWPGAHPTRMQTAPIVRSTLLGLALAAVVGCSATVAGTAAPATDIPTTAAPTTTAAARVFHPSGYRLARGAVRTTADFGEGHPSRLRIAVGDVVRLRKGEWLPDNSPYSTALGATLVLAADDGVELSYQAVRAGKVSFAIGPVGHPGGCDQPGKNCADATPPPELDIVVG